MNNERLVIHVEKGGENALAFLLRSGFSVPSDCGGHGVCGKCRCTLDGKPVLACVTILPDDCVLAAEKAREDFTAAASFEGMTAAAGSPDKVYAAVDIGTTTCAVCFFDEFGAVLSAKTTANPQRKFGADVISRVGACAEHLTEMTEAVRGAVHELISSSDTVPEKIVLVGNTAMLAIFAGLDCSKLGYAPYDMPEELKDSLTLDGEIIGFSGVPLITPPCVSSFIGADAYACALMFDDGEKIEMIADVGTNGEVLLKNGGEIFCASAAAGPALEAGGLSCGAGAVNGAVCAAEYKNGVFAVKTIGGVTPPAGICGSGVIDALAEFLKAGIMDETGRLTSGNIVEICENVSITQADIRRVQAAKSALRSCIDVLIDAAALPDVIKLARGFGLGANMANMAETGLLPPDIKTKAAGNLALGGAIKYACGKTAELSRFKTVELAQNELFEQLFIDNMYFGQGC